MLEQQTILIDLTPLLPGGANGGAKVFILDLIKSMIHKGKSCRLLVVINKVMTSELMELASDRVELVALELHDAGTEHKEHRNKIHSLEYDCLFCPFTEPYFHKAGIPTVSVIYDLQFQTYPQFFTDADVMQRRESFIKACRYADALVTISDYVKESVIRYSPVALCNKTRTIHINPADLALKEYSENQRKELLSRLNIESDNYLLYPANFWKHKNHEMLLTAFSLYLSENKDATQKLVLTGHACERQNYLIDVAQKMGISHRVVFADFLEREEFSILFRQCRAIIFPSLYEGFGMPVLEAMKNAKPILCSNVTSLPEVGGEAAFYFDPRNPREIAQAIVELDNNTKEVEKRVSLGLESSKLFGDVSVMTDKYLEVFAEVMVPENKMTPPLSIITPSYNQGQYIEKTINSVLSQGVENLEYVVMDGGSTDETKSILKKYESEGVYWVSEKDNGQTHAVNKGIEHTSGEIIGWLNSDDIYYPHAFEKVLTFFEAHPDVDIIYGNANHIDVDDNILEPYPTEAFNFERLKDVCFISQPAVFFRRSIVEKCGLLDESLNFCMDYEYWIRLAQKGAKFAWLQETLAATRIYQDTKTMGMRYPVHGEICLMLKKRLGKAPSRWISVYAPIWVEHRTQIKPDQDAYLFKLGLITILLSLKWNRVVDKEIISTVKTHYWNKHGLNGFKYSIKKRFTKIHPRRAKSLVKKLFKTREKIK